MAGVERRPKRTQLAPWRLGICAKPNRVGVNQGRQGWQWFLASLQHALEVQIRCCLCCLKVTPLAPCNTTTLAHGLIPAAGKLDGSDSMDVEVSRQSVCRMASLVGSLAQLVELPDPNFGLGERFVWRAHCPGAVLKSGNWTHISVDEIGKCECRDQRGAAILAAGCSALWSHPAHLT